MRTVLVAIGDSDDAVGVVSFVNRFFNTPDFEVIGINVARRNFATVPYAGTELYAWSYSPRVGAELESEMLIEEQHARSDAEDAVADSGLRDAEVIGEVGEPIEAILRAAAERNVDLIVVGASHRGVLSRIIEPDVSKAILKESPRPVLVVP